MTLNQQKIKQAQDYLRANLEGFDDFSPREKLVQAMRYVCEVVKVREATGHNDGEWVEAILNGVKLGEGYAWCAATIEFCMDVAGLNWGPSDRASAAVVSWYNLAKKDKKLTKKPQRGDLCVKINADKVTGHIGVVVKTQGNYVSSFEGNAQPLTSKVLTTSGWKKMGDIELGEELIDPCGNTTKVVGVYPQGQMPVYKVHFADGRVVEASDNHLWKVKKWNDWRIMNTLEMKEFADERGTTRRLQLPELQNLDVYPKKELEMDPYLLGALLGDGGLSHHTVKFTTKDTEILDYIQPLLKGLNTKPCPTANGPYDYALTTNIQGNNWLRRQLDNYGLDSTSEHKFIPKHFLHSNLEDRLELLRGLMDTDGHCDTYGRLEYSSCSYQLIKDLQELVWSLGGRAFISTRNNIMYTSPNQLTPKAGKVSYRIALILPQGIQPFKLTRKVDRYNPERVKGRSKSSAPYITHIEFDRIDECQCIKVDSADSLYVTDSFVITHNKSPGNTGSQQDGQGAYRRVRELSFWDYYISI